MIFNALKDPQLAEAMRKLIENRSAKVAGL
jgi:hypothetical protein